MKSLCFELESGSKKGEKAQYINLFQEIKDWYHA